MEEAFFDPSRVRLVMGGERAGKSFSGALQLVCRMNLGRLFWVVAEEYETCVPEMEYARDFLYKLGALKEESWPNEGPKSLLTYDGVVIESRSANDYRRIAEKAPDGIVGAEVGRWRWESYLRVNSRLAEKRGWAWLCGSFDGSVGWQTEKHVQWQGSNIEGARAFSVPTPANEFIFSGENDPEIERLRNSMPLDRFMERHMARPVPPSGRVYREFEYVTHVSEEAKYRPGTPVELWVDPGFSGAYVVLAVQEVGDGLVNSIDEVYVQRLTNAEVINACQRRPWWRDHTTVGTIDILGGKQHHAERSPIEAWRELAQIRLEGEYVHIRDGIERVHTFLKYDNVHRRPGLLVHPRCVGLIAEMGAGKHHIEGMGYYKYRTDSSGNVVSETPIEGNNHACNALAYGLVRRYGLVKRTLGGSVNYRDNRGRGVNYRRRTPSGIDPELWQPGQESHDTDVGSPDLTREP